MKRAIAMAEFKTVSTGILAADRILKTANVEIIEASTVCPGKYIILFTGDLSAVEASLQGAVKTYEDQLIDSFLLGNPHEDIFPAIYGTSEIKPKNALGVLETFSAAGIITAADAAAKAAIIDLIEIRIARGMCGKSYIFLSGEVASVTAAIESAKQAVLESGMYLDSSIIANPDSKLWETIC